MEYGKIIAVTGMPGLYELLSSKNDGAIVRSLEDKSSKFVSSRIHNFSHLESIEVFTVKDNVNLIEIFNAMEKEGGKVPDGKDGGALKKYFEKIYPDLDFERVYSSDLKKMVKWFDVLKANQIEIKLTEPAEEEEEEEAQPAEEELPASEKKAKSSDEAAEAPKKKAKTKPAPEGVEEEKPKKAAVKKVTERKEPNSTSGVDEANKKDKKAPAKKSAPKKK